MGARDTDGTGRSLTWRMHAGIGLRGFKAGTNFMPMVVLSAANIDTVSEAVQQRGRTDDLFAHLATLFRGMELHNYNEVQDLKILVNFFDHQMDFGSALVGGLVIGMWGPGGVRGGGGVRGRGVLL